MRQAFLPLCAPVSYSFELYNNSLGKGGIGITHPASAVQPQTTQPYVLFFFPEELRTNLRLLESEERGN